MRNIRRIGIGLRCGFAAVLICCSFGFGLAPSARADAIYTYTGQPFTNFQGAYSCTNGVGECSISGTITFVSPLSPNSVFSIFQGFLETEALPPNLLSFSITDGVHIFSNGGDEEFGVALDTGSNGQIVGWNFFIADSPTFGMGTTTAGFFGGGFTEDLTSTSFQTFASASNTDTPGTWTLTTTSVPEPSTLILLGTGFLGMAGAWRWKVRGKASTS